MPDINLKILLIEDKDKDQGLLGKVIKQGSENFHLVKHVRSLEEARLEFNQDHYNVILADLDLQATKGFDTFNQINNSFPDLPIIILTAEADEELGRTTVRMGAQDYLVKGQFDEKLLFRTAMYATERMKLRVRLLENESKYKNLIEQSQDAIYVLFENKFELINEKFTQMLGYNLDDLNHHEFDFRQIIHPDSMPIIEERIKRVSEGKKVDPTYEFMALAKNGMIIDCEASVTHIKYKGGIASQGILRDIRKRKQAELALIDSENQFRRLFENIPVGIYRISAQGKILMANKSLCHMLGYTTEEIKNISVKNGYTDKTSREKFMKVTLDGGVVYAYEDTWKTKDGGSVQVQESSRPVYGEDGEVLFYEGTVQDITELKIAEDKLKESRERLNFALQGTAAGLWDWDIASGKTVFNERWAEIVGYKLQELMPTTYELWQKFLHPEDLKMAENRLEDYFSGKSDSYVVEFRMKHKSGHWVWVQANGKIFEWDSNNKPARMTGTHIDITERKNADLALRESEERFREVYENSAVGIFRISTAGEYQLANPAFVKMFGYSDLDDLKAEKAEKNTPIFLDIAEHSDENVGVDKNMLTKYGREFDAHINLRTIRDPNNNIKYFEGTIEDVTEIKKVEAALIKAKEVAEKSNRMKSEFLAQISHEIRTPINSILSFTSLIKNEIQEKLEDDDISFDIIDRAGKRLIRTVDLILNMSELQTGSYDYKPQKIDVFEPTLNELTKEYKKISEKKKLKMKIEKLTENTEIEADEYSVAQIFANLLDNAVKYTHEGAVSVKVFRDKSEKLVVEVEDTGVGIGEEYLPEIFEPFSQEESGYTRKFEGNGLGLALVKKYCELNKAAIQVKSSKGKGTTFRVKFP